MNNSLSIVIITYNRAADMLDLLQNIAQLDDAATLADVVIVNNRSTEDYSEVEAFIQQHPHIPFRYEVAAENLGVSRGRNAAVKKSSGDILLFLDDDALFQNKDAIQQARRIFSETGSEDIGIASFKVLYHSTMQLQQTAFPHKQFKEKKNLHRFDAAYFVGCAHAIRRELFDKAGFYPDNFFYGMEEYDLSYRAIESGYRIVYDDRLVILHKESPEGRLPRPEKLRGMWVNKSKVAWKYLPEKYFNSTALLWSLEYLKKTGFDLKGFKKGWQEIRNIPVTERRKPIGAAALNYLKKVGARLHY